MGGWVSGRSAAAIMMVLLTGTGCGRFSSEPANTAGEPNVAFVVPNTSLSFAKTMADGFAAGVRQVGGVNFSIVGTPRNDSAGQAKLLDELISSGRADGGIALFQQATDLFSPLVTKGQERGIPIIAVDNKMDGTNDVGLFIGNDNHLLGEQLADEVIKRLPEDAQGEIVLGTPLPGVPVLDLRAQGIRDQFRKRLPGVDVVGPLDTKQDPLVNRSTWKGIIAANPTALAYVGTADQDAVSLAALRKRHRGPWLAGAFDVDRRVLPSVKAGDLVLMSPEHFVKGALAGHWQAQHAKDGQPLPKGWLYTPGLAVTQANVDEITKRESSETAREAWFKPHVEQILDHQARYLRPMSDAR